MNEKAFAQPAGFLAPAGRAEHQGQISHAHRCGEFLAQKNIELCCDMPTGEVGAAFVSGALTKKGKVTLYHQNGTPVMKLPEGGNIIEIDTPTLKTVAETVSHFWVLPCGIKDLGRYLEMWLASACRPLVCLSKNDDFLLLRGFVEEIVTVDRPDAAERLVFAKSVEEGWDKISEILVA